MECHQVFFVAQSIFHLDEVCPGEVFLGGGTRRNTNQTLTRPWKYIPHKINVEREHDGLEDVSPFPEVHS